jgi:prolyl-tRNA synthetase
MRLSRFFMPILKENPKEAEIVSHRLMLRTGMVRQQSSGIYTWLPLGKRVLDKVNAVIREEQNRSGAIELLMPTLQSAELWQESATTPTARKCCASRTGRTGRCSTVRRTRK